MAAPSDKNEIFLSSSPHISRGMTTSRIMLTVCASLLPLCVCGVVFFGISALVTICVSTASCVLFEFLFRKIVRKPCRAGDCSAVVTGLLLALVLPPAVPIWMIMLASLFAIVVAKEFFGGLGMNVFNPALCGRAFLVVSFPAAMSAWSKTPFASLGGIPAVDATSTATVLVQGMNKAGVSYLDLFLGNHGGCIGETCSALILLAFAILALTRIIDWRAPVTMVATVVVYEWAFTGKYGLFTGDALFAFLSGGLLFGAVFMTTDYTTSPVTKKGRVAFGFGCGMITALIRHFSGYPEGVMFSILIMNAVVPFLNRLIGKKYGFVSAKKTAQSANGAPARDGNGATQKGGAQ